MATKVLVDAGHGGWDNGATYEGRREKNDNLKLAIAVGEILEENGVDVVYTRTEDIYQSPTEKARIGNQEDVDYFVSLHRNSSTNNNQYSGVQTLLYDGNGVKREIADNINQNLEDVGFQNLGIDIRRDLAVLRLTEMPALLVETGFINTDADNQVFEEQFQEIANAIAQGILQEIPEGNGKEREYRIQVGLFRNQKNAENLANQLALAGYTVVIQPYEGFYRVLVGSFKQLSRAEKIETILKNAGYNTLIIAI